MLHAVSQEQLPFSAVWSAPIGILETHRRLRSPRFPFPKLIINMKQQACLSRHQLGTMLEET